MDFKESIKILMAIALAGLCISLLGYAFEPRVPEDGWWIILKSSLWGFKTLGLLVAGLMLLVALLHYTGFHHKKKAGSFRIGLWCYFAAALLIVGSLIGSLIAAHFHMTTARNLILFIGGPTGIVFFVISFLFSGAAKRPDNHR